MLPANFFFLIKYKIFCNAAQEISISDSTVSWFFFSLKIYDALIQSSSCQLFRPFDLTHSITMSFAVLHIF